MPAEATHHLDKLCHAELQRWPLAGPPEQADAIRAVLAEDAPIVGEDRGPAYWLSTANYVPPHAAEAGVETLAAFRGKGYAIAAVAGWAAAVQQSQRIALYSTSWQNQASQAVAKKLGAVSYGEDWSIT
jgi:RimJ/RimL family protein N-acetyltransferase